MQSLIVLFAVLAVALCSPLFQQEQSLTRRVRQTHGNPPYVIIPIVRQSQDVREDGSFNWGYESGNGIVAQEQGVSKQIGPEESENSVQGEYKYQSPEGETVFAKYIADKLGFRIIEASHVPTPPPVSEEILKSLAYNAAHPEEEAQYEKKKY